VAFVVPLVYFGARGKIPKSIKGRLGFLLALGSTQGLVGWWMVRSGLTEHSKLDVDSAEEWQVSTLACAKSHLLPQNNCAARFLPKNKCASHKTI
jgi:heme A synthase